MGTVRRIHTVNRRARQAEERRVRERQQERQQERASEKETSR